MDEEAQLKQAFANRLDTAIKTLKLNQCQAAEKAGLTQPCISQYLNALRLPGYRELRKICVGLNIGANYLLGIDNEP